jgi:peptidoglycan LD-endopeptidase CwlK
MASRKIEDLVPALQSLYREFDRLMKEAGIDYIVTCTRRTQAEQDKLYAQGRTIPGKKVTWTRQSKHIEGRAFDIAVMKDGKITWNVKDYFEPARIGQSVGLTSGSQWKTPDYPHFEI